MLPSRGCRGGKGGELALPFGERVAEHGLSVSRRWGSRCPCLLLPGVYCARQSARDAWAACPGVDPSGNPVTSESLPPGRSSSTIRCCRAPASTLLPSPPSPPRRLLSPPRSQLCPLRSQLSPPRSRLGPWSSRLPASAARHAVQKFFNLRSCYFWQQLLSAACL